MNKKVVGVVSARNFYGNYVYFEGSCRNGERFAYFIKNDKQKNKKEKPN